MKNNSLLAFLCILFIPFALLSTDLEEKPKTPILQRTASVEELAQLQKRKEELLQQQNRIKQEARHREIEKLKKEIQELEAENLLLQDTHNIPTSARYDSDENEARVSSQINKDTSSVPISLTSTQLAMKQVLERICDHYQDTLESISTSRRKGFHNEVFIYALAKRCETSIQRVRQAIEVIKYEQNLVPSDELISAFISSKLKQPFENEKAYQDTISFDAVPFSTTFFVANYNPQFTYDENQLRITPLDPSTLEQTYRSLSGTPSLEHLKLKLSDLLESHLIMRTYPYKNKIYFNYFFHVLGTYSQGRSRSHTSLIGFVLFNKPIDAYMLME
jgi:hypothetical protein